jgi:YD repeat-containing protein
MTSRMGLRCQRLLAVGLAVLSNAALAVEVIPDFYKDPGPNPNRDYVNQSFKEHIDPFTGALQLHYVDIHLPGDGGFDLSVVRSYSSNSFDENNPAAFDSQAGLGWSIHFGRVLHKSNTLPCSSSVFGFDTLSNPVIELPDGSVQLLVASGQTSPAMFTTQRWKADCGPGGIGLVVYSPDGTRYDMTQQVTVGSGTNARSAWYTKAIIDRNGNTATINYVSASSSRVSTVSTSDQRSLTFLYNANGFVSSISTTDFTYTYNYQAISGVAGAFNLTQVVRPGGTSWQYQYNAVLNNVPGSYALRQVIYPEGGTITYGYGTTSSDYVYFDAISNPASRSTVIKSKSTSDSGSWSYSYSPGAVGTFDTTTVNAPSGTITYKHAGPNYASSGTLWMVGLLMQKQVGSLQTETYTWTQQTVSGQQFKRPGAWQATRSDAAVYAAVLASRTIARNGQTYTTNFNSPDPYGNPTSIVESGPNGGSRTTAVTYFNGAVKWILRLVQNQTVSGGVAITRSFDGNGNLSSITRDGVTTTYLYHLNGNASQATFPRSLVHGYPNYKFGIPLTENQPAGITIQRSVSNVGNVGSETNGEGRTTGFQYDGLNRLTRIDYPQSNPVVITYTATSKSATRGGLQEVTSVDGFGRPVSVTLGGIARAYRYDAMGRLTFASDPNSAAGTSQTFDTLNRLTGIVNADGTGRVISYSAASKTVRDERGNSTTYVYRAYGDPDQSFLMSIQAPDASVNVSMARNAKDLVTSVTQGGLSRIYGYDSRGYLTSVTNPETGVTTYGRDAAGNMTSRTVGSSGLTTYGYDGQNRLATSSYPGGTPAVSKTYSRTHKVATVVSSVASRTFGYDANDNLTSEQLTIDGRTFVFGYGYNSNDQLASNVYPVSSRVVSYSPDSLGRPTLVSGFVNSVAYWPSGQINQISYANATTTTYGQNTRLWPSSFVVAKGATGHLSSSYLYDGVGNLTSISDSLDSTYNRTVGYDLVNRITSISGPWGAGSIGYDGAGNIRSQALGSYNLSYAYNASNLLAGVTGSRTGSYSYDAYGNIVGSGSSTYSYDGAPNLLCANCSDAGTRVDYQYDGLNQRVSSQRAGVKTYEFYAANGNLIAEFTPAASNRLVEHIYLGGRRIAQVEPTPSSVNPGGGAGGLVATAGRSITLSVTVAGSSPTGTVSFYDGATLLGTVQLVNGTAALTTTFANAGARTITINYSGDASNAPSSSTVVVNVLIAPEVLIPILQLLLEE